MEKHFSLPQKVGQAILDYLTTRPYGEVFQLIQSLQPLMECTCRNQTESTEAEENKKS